MKQRVEFLKKIDRIASLSQLEKISHALESNKRGSDAEKTWSPSLQTRHSSIQAEVLFYDKGVHWDQLLENGTYHQTLNAMLETLGKKGEHLAQ